jgi:hypothetical protein
MKITDRLPFADRPHVVIVRGEPVYGYRNQIIVWNSIDDVLRPLPAILDTGHGHNLSIGEGQLRRWSGASLKRIFPFPLASGAKDRHCTATGLRPRCLCWPTRTTV